MNQCPECNKEHNDDRRKICGSCRIKRSRRRTKEKAVQHMGGECSKCGYKKSMRALEFHHLDPTEKDLQVSMSKNNSWEKIKEELKKCILVCSNCHAEIHEEIENKKNATLVDVVITLV